MTDHDRYTPGSAHQVEVRKDGEKWTLILVRELRHAPEKVWQAITEPAHQREWAPFEANDNMAKGGPLKLTWTGTAQVVDTTVTRAEAPRVLEFNDMRWELEPVNNGTRLTLWHSIDRRFVAWGAAGWHICFDVLERRLAGEPIERIAGPAAMKFEGWQRLSAEYAKQFGAQTPSW
jgi:uncharacterized protein YndB with AHSA1/START domain